jgi:prenylcysteine oxidase / farnesylcysteine lyase
VHGNASQPAELGASIFVEVNRNLFNAAKEFGLSMGDAGQARPQEAPERLGVWNGKEFVFTQSDGSPYWWNIAKLLWKYGWAPIRAQSLMKSTVGKFLKMYESPYFPFRSLSQTAYDLGLTNVTSETGEQFLNANNILPAFSNDIVQASTRVNYAQNLRFIHALEAMVCMAAQGAVAVDGGNWQIFHRMVKASGATVKLNTTVQQIHKTDSGTYIVTSRKNPSTPTSLHQEDEYDDVVLAAPFQDASIDFTPPLPHIPDKIPYVKLHVTLVASPHRLSPSAFNLPPDALVPSVVLTTLGSNETPLDREAGVGRAGFFSISTLRRVVNPKSHRSEYLYKIFSPHPITKTSLSHFLSFSPGDEDGEDADDDNVTWIHRHVWNAYPYLYPRVTFEDPVLDHGLWYTSGIESFISTMETSSLMGMNVARLMLDTWEDVKRKSKGEEKEKKLVREDL